MLGSAASSNLHRTVVDGERKNLRQSVCLSHTQTIRSSQGCEHECACLEHRREHDGTAAPPRSPWSRDARVPFPSHRAATGRVCRKHPHLATRQRCTTTQHMQDTEMQIRLSAPHLAALVQGDVMKFLLGNKCTRDLQLSLSFFFFFSLSLHSVSESK